MEEFVKRMIDEHKVLIDRINKLETFIYSEQSNKVNKVEFANMCVQLKGMRMYEEALRARLANHGVVFENCIYYKPVDATYIPRECCGQCENPPVASSDFDAEKEDDASSEEVDCGD